MEATGYSRWFERLLAELGFELWIGNQSSLLNASLLRTISFNADFHFQIQIRRKGERGEL
jgi:hypothetical protein